MTDYLLTLEFLISIIMKKLIAIFILVNILLQSCVVYQQTSVSIENSVLKGSAKVINDSGHESQFKEIKYVDNNYFGVRKGYSNEHLLKLDSTKISHVYLKDIKKTKNRKLWISLSCFIGVPIAIIGIAYAAEPF